VKRADPAGRRSTPGGGPLAARQDMHNRPACSLHAASGEPAQSPCLVPGRGPGAAQINRSRVVPVIANAPLTAAAAGCELLKRRGSRWRVTDSRDGESAGSPTRCGCGTALGRRLAHTDEPVLDTRWWCSRAEGCNAVPAGYPDQLLAPFEIRDVGSAPVRRAGRVVPNASPLGESGITSAEIGDLFGVAYDVYAAYLVAVGDEVEGHEHVRGAARHEQR
jgi:hypothetical protein